MRQRKVQLQKLEVAEIDMLILCSSFEAWGEELIAHKLVCALLEQI